MQARMPEAAWRMPTDRLALIVAIGDIEGAVDQGGEAKPRSGAEIEHAHAALDAIAQRHKPDTCELREHAGALGDFPAGKRLSVELHHQCTCLSLRSLDMSAPMIRLS